MLNGKATIIILSDGLIKKSIKWLYIFLNCDLWEEMQLKNTTDVDTSKFAKKVDLANLK